MPDFNQILTPGDTDEGLVQTVVEIPQGSRLKIEWNKYAAAFMLDRVEPGIYAKPVNYGFIPQTLDEDGDELDTLIICSEPIPTGVYLEARILGVMRFEDDGEVDDKIVCVPADDRDSGDALRSMDDLPHQWQKQIEEHFTNYKNLKKPGTTIVKGWGDIDEAKAIIKQCIVRYSKK